MASASATALTFDMLRLSPAPSRPQSARKSPRDFPAHVLGDVHLPNSADRAIGGAVSAGLNPITDANGNIPPAMLAGIETLVGGGAAAALGFNAQGAATAAQNETLNNYLNHVQTANFCSITEKLCAKRHGLYQSGDGELSKHLDAAAARRAELQYGDGLCNDQERHVERLRDQRVRCAVVLSG